MSNFKGGSRPRASFGARSASRPPFKKKPFGKPSFGSKFGARPSSRPSMGGDRQMFSAVCSECGDKCEVPFEPFEGRAVQCRNCFVPKTDERGERPAFGKFAAKKPYGKSFGDRAERPRRDFERKEFTPAPNNNKQFEEISAKLDLLIAAVEKMTEAK